MEKGWNGRKIKRATYVVLVVWICLLAGSYYLGTQQEKITIQQMALTEARSSYNKDLVYRRWSALHGGVYVQPTEKYPPNPYLAHIPHRDVVTLDGRQLTLTNPAYMTRQVHELGQEQYGERGHITSLNPLRPENSPDAWEAEVLRAFEDGVDELSSIEIIDGQPYMRFMKAMITEQGCLKCHAQQGYELGEVRGGISVSVPYGPYLTMINSHQALMVSAHGLIAGIGVLGILFAGRYVSRSQELILSSEKRHRMALSAANDGIWEWNIETNEEFFSPRWCEIIGYSYDDPELPHTYESWEKRIHPDDHKRVMKALVDHLEKGDKYEVEYRHLHKSGEYRWQRSVGETERDVNGKPVKMIGYISDITQRKQAELENVRLENSLQQARKMEAVGTMAGGIAHNFNNSLAIILGSLELAMLKKNDSGEVTQHLGTAKTALLRSRDLVKKLLIFSRNEEHELTPVRLAEVVGETTKLLQSTIPTTIKLQEKIAPDLNDLSIKADASSIHEAIINLCNNAVFAMEEKGVLTIALDKVALKSEEIPPGYQYPATIFARLEIKDTGYGIPPNVIDKIFDPFFTTKEVNQGTGMGLATVQGIVEMHEGFIEVETVSGKGTAFQLYFPVWGAETVTEVTVESAPFEGSGRILFVDDDEMLVSVNRAILEAMGYRVTCESDAAKALDLVRANPQAFDLLITDQTMPNLTGTELAQQLKRINPNLPIILCTGYSSKTSGQSARTLGIDAFCMKPLEMSELGQKIKKCLTSTSHPS